MSRQPEARHSLTPNRLHSGYAYDVFGELDDHPVTIAAGQALRGLVVVTLGAVTLELSPVAAAKMGRHLIAAAEAFTMVGGDV